MTEVWTYDPKDRQWAVVHVDRCVMCNIAEGDLVMRLSLYWHRHCLRQWVLSGYGLPVLPAGDDL